MSAEQFVGYCSGFFIICFGIAVLVVAFTIWRDK